MMRKRNKKRGREREVDGKEGNRWRKRKKERGLEKRERERE